MTLRLQPVQRRVRPWLVVPILALVAACSAAPSPPTSPSGGAAGPAAESSSPTDGQPHPTDVGPPPSFEPLARDPLPGPELEAPEDIAEALLQGHTRLHGVVSLLAQLGIGTYSDTGEPITPGAEVDGGTLWLTESEVHAVAEMAAADHPRDFVEFRDWHSGLAELGLELSVDELVAAYEEAYYADVEGSFFTNLIFATGLDLHADGLLTHLQAWLLLLDGFVVGAGAESSVMLASYHEPQWGGASAFLPRLLAPGSLLTGVELTALLARLEPLVRATPLVLEPPVATAHEGHDGPGDETTLTLRFVPHDITALDIGFQLVPARIMAGLPVTFAASAPDVLAEHGTMRDPYGGDPFASGAPQLTDSYGTIRLTYTPREEEADGAGEIAVEPVRVTASVPLREIAKHTWLLPDVLYSMLWGDRSVEATLQVEWHEAEGLRVRLTDVYDVTIDLILGVGRRTGTDTFTGFLALQDDGTWRGTVQGTTSGSWNFESFESCSTPLGGRQQLLAVAEVAREPTPEGGEIRIRFYPIEPPTLDSMGCDYTLNRWPGDDYDDPSRPRGSGIPAQDYAPFNNALVTDPEVLRGVPAPLPSVGSETITWTEELAGVGGGTWTVTVERVEADR